MIARLVSLSFILSFLFAVGAEALEDPTRGRAFVDWAWRDQLLPTLETAIDVDSLLVLSGGTAATLVSFSYDRDIRETHSSNARISSELSGFGSLIGSGPPGVVIALAQLAWDQENGLAHSRALVLTSMSHVVLATISQRERPRSGDFMSFPSGHGASAFTTATSLAYAYGWPVGVPALALATFASATRWADNAHWLSDTVMGAALGIYWARASALSDRHRKTSDFTVSPLVLPGGGALVVAWTH